MGKKILITGISGFIGRHVARRLLNSEYQVTAIIRPNTEPGRIKEFEKFDFEEIDLGDTYRLEKFLNKNRFDYILHIGALRGGRAFPKDEFYRANIKATEQLIINAHTNNSFFIFCSSVGVFGAVPKELPATETTPRQNDNYYHYTKIEAEKLIRQYVQSGLKAAIVRPSITYGIGDYGFPYTLVKLVDKGIMLLPLNKDVMIHLTNVETLADAFYKLTKYPFSPGSAFIIADKKPIYLPMLVDFISQRLYGGPYSNYRRIPASLFDCSIFFARMIKSELWTTRFKLISRSWYYDTSNTYNELGVEPVETIPSFEIVIDWYKKLK